ncbi:MAG TPA: hypothetical protein VHW46_08010 [Terracidiphilus sp.]|jgi:hypothetical protein|nr:hypothetical protein [Terracidiphilus sp.]
MNHFAKICLVALALGFSNSAFAQPSGPALPPVPPAISAAKTVFLSNAGADSGLFPQPFSGDTNRAYAEFFSSLQSSGAFQLTSDPAYADLVLELQLTAPNGPSNANKQNGTADPRPMFRLTIFDRKTHYVLWTVTESIGLAVLQKTHDRNFDDALAAVLSDFLAVAGKPPVTPH